MNITRNLNSTQTDLDSLNSPINNFSFLNELEQSVFGPSLNEE